ncbi:metalloprotease PmbA [Salinicola avicenniae]|uniref:metalloprotease PmbA n=1 Tax=Salinicola avicenniae TaxID=2916836 RepID=UPI0020730222|nr:MULTISPECIES: metalloprotease PmbA [unclassified Salinicola]
MSQAFNAVEQQARLEERAAMALGYARRAGADACEVGASVDQGVGVSVRLGETENVELSRDQSIAVTVYVGQRKGNASSSDASDASIRAVVDKAISIARYTGEDPAAGLAPAELMATDLPELDLHHPWALSVDEAVELALRCESAGREQSGITNSEGASLSSSEVVTVYANSHGFIGSKRGTRHSLSCLLIAGSGDGMQRDHDFTTARRAEDLASPESVGISAAERTLRRLGGQRPQTGRLPVLFAPEMARGLVGNLLNSIAGGALYRESSFLCDALGETLFPTWFTLGEQPREIGGLASAAFDADGVATRDNVFIDRGRLASYMLSAYSARRLGLESTGNAGGAHNVRIEAPTESLDTLMQRMGTGILVTEMMGQGLNPVTGDYSRGAAGFWVENGQISHPVEEFTVAGNLREMFAGLQGVGSDIDRRGSIQTGSWLIDTMTIAGQ